MDKELLEQLINNPARWPFYLFLAAIVIVILKLIGAAADALTKHVSEQLRNKKGLLAILKIAMQAIATTLVIYLANAIYWTHTIERLMPSAEKKPIVSCTATVELIIQSENKEGTHFMDSGGYLAFGTSGSCLLKTSASDSWGQPLGTNEYQYRGIFNMSATDSIVGKPIETLKQADMIQVKFDQMPADALLLRGRAVCVLNGNVQIEFPFEQQKARDGMTFIRNLNALGRVIK